MALAFTCTRESRYGPRHRNISDERLKSVAVGATAADVQRQLGPPSFIWTRKQFLPQRYPSRSDCARHAPAAMWVYYDAGNGSACLFFDNTARLVCTERNDIVIAQ
jgi:hypothetical protein